jgi:hypothetical protein
MDKGRVSGTSPAASPIFYIGHNYLVHLCSTPLYFVRMKKVASTG